MPLVADLDTLMDGEPACIAAAGPGGVRAVTAGELRPVGDEVAAYRLARAKATLVQLWLGAAGFTSADFPQLCPSLDLDGRPVVVIGPVSTATAARLRQVLGHGSGSGSHRVA